MLEAAACGLPLVLTPVGHAPEMFTDGDSALFVRAGDDAALAAALVRLAGEAGLGARLGGAAREAAEECGLEAYAKRVGDLYLELWERSGEVTSSLRAPRTSSSSSG
jgi:glycosyltransferase involved in cell wall biosynthesis